MLVYTTANLILGETANNPRNMKTGKCLLPLLTALVLLLGAVSCSDNINESNLYVFTGESATDFVRSQPELSMYCTLLTKARSGIGKGSTMDHMLESRGNYTCFIPTNQAIQMFLDSVYNRNNYDVNEVPDSMARVIVFNSVIDNGNVDAYKSTDFYEGVLQIKTMADRYIVINFQANDSGKVITRVNTYSRIISADNKVENGQIHVVDRVVMPATTSLPGLMGIQDNLRIFHHLLEVTSWADSMTQYRDEEYELQDHPQNYKHVWYSTALEHYVVGLIVEPVGGVVVYGYEQCLVGELYLAAVSAGEHIIYVLRLLAQSVGEQLVLHCLGIPAHSLVEHFELYVLAVYEYSVDGVVESVECLVVALAV